MIRRRIPVQENSSAGEQSSKAEPAR